MLWLYKRFTLNNTMYVQLELLSYLIFLDLPNIQSVLFIFIIVYV